MPEHLDVRPALVGHQIVVALVEHRQVVVEPRVVLKGGSERVRAFVVVAEIHDRERRRAGPGTKPCFEHRGHRLLGRHAVAVRRAAAEHDNPIFAGPLPAGRSPAVAPDVISGRFLVAAVQIHVDAEQHG